MVIPPLFGHRPLNRCCFKGRAKFYLQYESSKKESSKQTTNKQTIVWSTIPVRKMKYINLIKNLTTCLEADRSAPCFTWATSFITRQNYRSSDINFSNLKQTIYAPPQI